MSQQSLNKTKKYCGKKMKKFQNRLNRTLPSTDSIQKTDDNLHSYEKL